MTVFSFVSIDEIAYPKLTFPLGITRTGSSLLGLVIVISASTSSTDLTLKITNPEDNNEDFEIVGFKVSGKVTSASFNDSTITNLSGLNEEIATKQVSLADGDSTELVLAAGYRQTVQVTSIFIKVDWQTFEINSDYTNVGKWSSFKVSAGDNGSDGGETVVDPAI